MTFVVCCEKEKEKKLPNYKVWPFIIALGVLKVKRCWKENEWIKLIKQKNKRKPPKKHCTAVVPFKAAMWY